MAGTTNLLQWNPTAANQENDAAYLADSQRAGGATDPSIFLSILSNKAFYQWSTYLTGLFQAFAAKGFTTSDSNLSTLTAQCANFLTTADILPAVLVLNYSTPLTLNASSANGFYVRSMTGNLVISAISSLTSGQIVALYYEQDGVGGRTVTYPSIVVGGAQPDPTANAVSVQLFGYDGTTAKLRALTPLVSNLGTFFPANVSVANILTAATAGTNENSTRVATTAWCLLGFTASIAANGYLKFPTWLGGLVIQWVSGSSVNGRGQLTVPWPVTFPNAFFGASATVVFDNPVTSTNNQGAAFYVQPGSPLNACNLQYDVRPDGNADTTYHPFLIGLGR